MVGGECTSTMVQIWQNGTPCACLTTNTVKSQFFLGGFKLALRDYGPCNLGGWRYRERNGSSVEREQSDATNYKEVFFTSEKGNLEFGTEVECQVLFW